MEPAQGSYDWTALDAAFAIVRADGKLLTLDVGVASAGLPGWLAGLGMKSYTFTSPTGGPVTAPIPWDPVFLGQYEQFIAALGAHVQAEGNMGLLQATSDGTPLAEMSIVGCSNGDLAPGVAYSRSTYLSAWESTIAAHAAAFPGIKLYVSAPVAQICMPDNDGAAFYADVMSYAFEQTKTASVFAADLNALGSQRMAQVSASIQSQAALTAFQTIWSYTGDPSNEMQGTISQAVCQGWNLGGRYFEIYKADLSNSAPSVQTAIAQARTGAGC